MIGELLGELDPLRLHAGKGGSRLPELEIPRADVADEPKRAPDRRDRGEEFLGKETFSFSSDPGSDS